MSDDVLILSSDNMVSDSIRACRACLDTKYTEHIQLDSDDWLELYKFCIDTEISENKLALVLCLKCSQLLREYADFKRVCRQSEIFWDSLLTKNLKCISNKSDFPDEIKTENLDSDTDIEKYNDDFNDLFQPLEEEQHEVFDDGPLELVKQEEDHTSLKAKKETKEKFIGKCNLCSKVYSRKLWLISHIQLCGTGVKRKPTVSKKLRAEDKEIAYCGICKNNIEKVSVVKEHLLEHYKNNDLSCRLCDHVALDFAEMMAHRAKHKPANFGPNTIHCILCPKFCFQVSAMEFHFRKVHLGKRGGYCRNCGAQFKALKPWKCHQFVCLHDNQGYKCDCCGKRFRYKSMLSQHILDNHDQTHHYVCEECGRTFKRKSNYKLHVTMTHTKSAAMKCHHCTRMFKSEIHLQYHLKKLAREHMYTCEVCSKQYVTPFELKKHMFWHTGERPHKCETCGRKYGSKSQLTVHKKLHLGIYAHKCTECDKTFVTSSLLRRHQSVHTGVRRHRCSLCERSFHNKKLLVEHSLRQHRLVVK